MNNKRLALLTLATGLTTTLVACGSETETKTTEKDAVSAVLVTDVAGVDDKSFNQGSWEALEAWGQSHGLQKGSNGYNYLESNSDSDYVTNLSAAVHAEYDMIFAGGYKLEAALKEVAPSYPESHFAIIDRVVELPNVASITFKDHQSSFLAGVAAGETSKTNKVGFIGGMHGEVIDRFEAGFIAGVKAVNPDAVVEVQYADSFVDAGKGKTMAHAMYSNGIDVIYHASAGVGNGIFSEAKEIVQADPSREVWVIGVDQDQSAEGYIDENRNVTLTSSLKGVGTAITTLCNDAIDGVYHDGEVLVFGLEDEGVAITDGEMTDEVKAKVEEYKAKIISGEQVVPEKVENSENN
ncbi:nucleoside-binding protein [Granulicatella balaenopterae]|uniref:Nucleoside-binding protein n=1 Tax=Granulicatella balaenopterae TaxID=137733 RepID=A0A1H9MNF8_9LACT|nr:BMP family protein [Granulicatella balaenopterae]SER25244.1 nucleoside-binding protein [Granulicatella balaenopterae]